MMSATFRNCHHLLSHSIYDLDLAIGDLVARSEALEMKEARTLMTRLYYVDSEGQGEEEAHEMAHDCVAQLARAQEEEEELHFRNELGVVSEVLAQD